MDGIGVVIPFYQREPGLLRRAVASVAEQAGLDGRAVRIVVVDDASPSPAAAELESIDIPGSMRLILIGQTANAGPGAARNRGIDAALAAGCGYVAFLDSDDWWAPPHLACAVRALDRGALFHFANSMHEQVTSFSYFNGMRGRVDAAGAAAPIPAAEAFALLLAECIPHTSQVVYVPSAFPALRFDETMRRSGEDHLFWLSVAHAGAALSCTMQVMGHRGRGVSVYRAGLAWDTPAFLERALDAYRFRRLVERRFALGPRQAAINARFREDALDQAMFALARAWRRRPAGAPAALARIVRAGALGAVLARAPRLPGIVRRMRGPAR